MKNTIKNLLLVLVCLLGVSGAQAQCGGCTPPPPPSITPNYTLYSTPTLPNSTTLTETTVISGTTYIQPPSYAATLASAIHQPHIYQRLTKKSNGQIFGGTTQYGPGTCPTCWMNFSVITNISFVPGDTFDTDTSGDITCTAMGSGGWAHLGGFGSTVQLELAYTLELSLGRRDTCQTNAAGINTCNYYVTQWCNQTPDLSVTTIRAIANPIPNYWDVWAVCTRTSQGAVWLCPTASVGLVGNAYAFDHFTMTTPPKANCTANNAAGHP